MVSLVWDELHYTLTIAETIDIETTHIQQTPDRGKYILLFSKYLVFI